MAARIVRLHAGAGARSAEHLRDRVHVHPLSRPAHSEPGERVQRAGVRPLRRDARPAARARGGLRLQNHGRRRGGHRGHGRDPRDHGEVVCAAHPACLLRRDAQTGAGIRPAESAARFRAAGHVGGGPVRPQDPEDAARPDRHLLDRRELRPRAEDRTRSVRVRLGSVLLRHVARARRGKGVQRRHHLRGRRAGADDDRACGVRPRSAGDRDEWAGTWMRSPWWSGPPWAFSSTASTF